MSELQIRVLGQVEAEIDGMQLPVSKPRIREILCLLVLGRGRVVSTSSLVDDLWEDAPANAVGSVRTFIGELRKILEPTRPARTPPRVVVTRGNGYALEQCSVDLWRVEAGSGAALDEWRGTAFEEFATRTWAAGERARLAELRASMVERSAKDILALGRFDDAIVLLDGFVDEHPWREEGWRMLATALYRVGRQADALSVVRRARLSLTAGLGLDPSDRLVDLEQQILTRDPSLGGGSILMHVAEHSRAGSRSQLESASALVPLLALSGSVGAATRQRLATITAAEQVGDPELTARVIAGYDVPGTWTRSDDPELSAAIVDAADRTLTVLPLSSSKRVRARLLSTIAMESRGIGSRVAEAAEAESIARRLGDPALLCLALSARYLQSFDTTGLARARRDSADEIVTVAAEAELSTFEIAGRIYRMQSLCALDDLSGASHEADLIDRLAERFDRPLASVFTAWFRYTFEDGPEPADTAEMPGFGIGMKALSELTTAVREGKALPDSDFGPYEPWARCLFDPRALDEFPDPPHDLMSEVCWCLVGTAARAVGHENSIRRAYEALLPAADERAVGGGVVDLGLIGRLVERLAQSLRAGEI